MRERFLILIIVVAMFFVLLNAFGDPHSDNLKVWSLVLFIAVIAKIFSIRKKRESKNEK